MSNRLLIPQRRRIVTPSGGGLVFSGGGVGQTDTINATATSYAFSAITIPDGAASDRLVVAVVTTRSTGTGSQASCDFGATTARQCVLSTILSNGIQTGIYALMMNSGSTVAGTVFLNSTASRAGIRIYSTLGASTNVETDFDSDSNANAASTSSTVLVNANGAAIFGAAFGVTSVNMNITGDFTEDATGEETLSSPHASHLGGFVNTSGSKTVTGTMSSGTTRVSSAACAWEP